MHVLFGVIKSEKLNSVPKSNHDARRKCLINELFDEIYDSSSRGLLAIHQPLFAMRLVQIRKAEDERFDRLFILLMRSASVMESKMHDQMLEGRLTKNQCASIEELEH